MDETITCPAEVVHPDTLRQALRSLVIGLWWLTLAGALPANRLEAWAEEHLDAVVDEIEARRCSR